MYLLSFKRTLRNAPAAPAIQNRSPLCQTVVGQRKVPDRPRDTSAVGLSQSAGGLCETADTPRARACALCDSTAHLPTVPAAKMKTSGNQVNRYTRVRDPACVIQLDAHLPPLSFACPVM